MGITISNFDEITNAVSTLRTNKFTNGPNIIPKHLVKDMIVNVVLCSSLGMAVATQEYANVRPDAPIPVMSLPKNMAPTAKFPFGTRIAKK
mmetsp:Transcript_39941/g.71987  ORF Transcript_39941/g.71987 Transcript_39941/m.71987 type:complete len:91 (+) Transcript_39941:1159-1431(+)